MSFQNVLHFTSISYWRNINPTPSKSRLIDRSINTAMMLSLCFGKRRSINFTICMVNLHSVVQIKD